MAQRDNTFTLFTFNFTTFLFNTMAMNALATLLTKAKLTPLGAASNETLVSNELFAYVDAAAAMPYIGNKALSLGAVSIAFSDGAANSMNGECDDRAEHLAKALRLANKRSYRNSMKRLAGRTASKLITSGEKSSGKMMGYAVHYFLIYQMAEAKISFKKGMTVEDLLTACKNSNKFALVRLANSVTRLSPEFLGRFIFEASFASKVTSEMLRMAARETIKRNTKITEATRNRMFEKEMACNIQEFCKMVGVEAKIFKAKKETAYMQL
jgi:hypothetical protein